MSTPLPSCDASCSKSSSSFHRSVRRPGTPPTLRACCVCATPTRSWTPSFGTGRSRNCVPPTERACSLRSPPTGAFTDLDHSLVERCLSGDEAAWEDLVRTHTRRVYGLCYRFTGKDGEAQDLTQEVFLRVYRTLKSFRATEGAFTTWLARLARNLLIDNYRRTRQERLTDSIEEQLPRVEESVSAASRPESMVAGREASEILQAGLQK